MNRKRTSGILAGLERPGLYVVCEVTGLYPSEEAAKADSDDPIGWVVACRLDDAPEVAPGSLLP